MIELPKLIFATNNQHKLSEIRAILEQKFEVVSLSQIGFNEEIPETQPTIEGNAHQKAQYIYDRYAMNCFADDTGLYVEALNGEPGVYSARYAGKNATYADNVNKLLKELDGVENRNAFFKTIICLIFDGKPYFFEGIVKGYITHQPVGQNGFGYDPIFIPEGHNLTYAQMSHEMKNSMSHRAIAVSKLADFLLNTKI